MHDKHVESSRARPDLYYCRRSRRMPQLPGTAVRPRGGSGVNWKLPNVHLCVASRPEMDIRTVLEPLTTLKISLHDEVGQKDDIIAYIKSMVRSDRSMREWREEDQNLVIETLSNNANGM